jgi:hypothetical protein
MSLECIVRAKHHSPLLLTLVVISTLNGALP